MILAIVSNPQTGFSRRETFNVMGQANRWIGQWLADISLRHCREQVEILITDIPTGKLILKTDYRPWL